MRTLDFSAGSGLVLRDGIFHVVADDENALFVFGPEGAVRRVVLLPGELPEKHHARKAQKPDFEILVDLREHGLLAMGSGSRPTRERAVRVDRGERCEVIDTSSKVEGIAADGDYVWLVTDADDRDVPSQLLRASLS
jgi:hypothetical protein